MTNSNCILATGLIRRFGADAPALGFDNVAVPRGGITALIGVSGVGKSTLLNLVGGVDRPDIASDGHLSLHFLDGSSSDLKHGDPYPHDKTSVVFQRGYLLKNASVGLNIASTATMVLPDYADELARDALKRVGLDETFLNKRPWQISGGEAQRVGLARALIRDPEILFADEPTSNLDEGSADLLMGSIKTWTEENPDRSVIWVSHDLELVFNYADRYIVMSLEGTEDGITCVRSKLRNKPGSVDELRSWISPTGKEPLPGGWPKRSTDTAPRPQLDRLAKKLSFSELFSARTKITQFGNGRFAEHLSRLTTQWREPWLLPSIVIVMPAFAHKMTTCLAFLSMLIFSLVSAAIWIATDDYLAQVSDPRNCHVVISGGDVTETDADGKQTAREQNLTPAVLERLGRRPWQNTQPSTVLADGELWPRSTCAKGPAAFGRRDFGKAWACRADIAAQVMVSNPSDPILAHARVLQGPYTGISVLDLSRNPSEHGFLWGGRTIFISEFFRDELEEQNVSFEDGLCLEIASKEVIFETVTVVTEFEAPRRSRYEAFIPESTYDIEIGVSGGGKKYSEAHIYFDPSNIALIDAFLRSEKWNFVEDAVARTTTIIENLRSKILVLFLFALANITMFLGVVFNLATAYLSKNAPSIAVLNSFGLPENLASKQGTRELGFALSIAFLILMILYTFGVSFFGEVFVRQTGLPSWSLAALLLASFAAHYLLALLATTLATRYWCRTHVNRSELLG